MMNEIDAIIETVLEYAEITGVNPMMLVNAEVTIDAEQWKELAQKIEYLVVD